MKKIIVLLISLLVVKANAGIITIEHNNLLPPFGTENIDLDMDGILDIGMAERFRGGDRAWFTLDSLPQVTQMVFGFIPEGELLDNSLVWFSDGFQIPVMSIGNNYLGIFNTSLGAFYGYSTISYDGIDMTLLSYTYDNSGAGIFVRSTSVPESGTLTLLGLTLANIVFFRRKLNKNKITPLQSK